MRIAQLFSSHQGEIMVVGKDHCGRDDLCRAHDEAVHLLNASGISAGDHVAVVLENGPAVPCALSAITSLGANIIPFHPASTTEDVQRFAEAYGVDYLLVDTANASSFQRLGSGPSSEFRSTHISWDGLELRGEFRDRARRETRGAILHPTSGTTGVPKVAVRSEECAIAEAVNYATTIGITDSDKILCVAPMSHAYAFGMCMMLSMLTGASLLVLKTFSPRLAMGLLVRENITVFPAVPTWLKALLLGGTSILPTHLRFVFSAGSPCPEEIAQQFREHTGKCVHQLYGLTETGGIAAVIDAPNGRNVGVGPVLRNVAIRLQSEVAQDERDGEVWVKSPSMMLGYLGEQGVEYDCLANGWFPTGDVGFVDPDGNLHLTGRRSTFINAFGFKVSAREVEMVIAGMPGVQDVVVYPRTHRSGSQQVAAAIVRQNLSVDIDEIVSFCRQKLASYKIPSFISFLEDIPRTGSGKTLLVKLPGYSEHGH